MTAMSSWERGRGIPWELIPQDGTDLDDQKERIYRHLQREALFEQQERSIDTTTNDNDVASGDNATTPNPQKHRFPYSNIDLLKQAAFGGCIGTITGAVFGLLDGMRAAGESPVIKNASDMAKFRFIVQGATHKATIFGVYFGGFHILKYVTRCQQSTVCFMPRYDCWKLLCNTP